MSHTPGPWISDGRVVGWLNGSQPGVAVRSEVERGIWSPVCMVQPDSTKQNPVYGIGGSFNPIDDARLIAAAPDLIAVLKRVRSEVPVGELERSTLTDAIDAAILKAEGR